MSEGKEIPQTDHVARNIRREWLDHEGNLTGAAFILRESEQYLSGNWLEFIDSSMDRAINMLITEIWPKRKLKTKGRYVGYFNYGEAKTIYSNLVIKQSTVDDSHVDIPSLDEIEFVELLAKICKLQKIEIID